MVNTEIRLIIFFAAKDGDALYSQQKQDQETRDCKPHGRAVLLGSLTLLLSTWAPFPNKISCFVSTCVSLDNSFLSVRQESSFRPRKGTHTIWSLLSTAAGDQVQEEGEVSFLIIFHPVPQILAKSLPEKVLLRSACSPVSCFLGWAGEERSCCLPLWFTFPFAGAQAQSHLSLTQASNSCHGAQGFLAHKPGGT